MGIIRSRGGEGQQTWLPRSCSSSHFLHDFLMLPGFCHCFIVQSSDDVSEV
jgi:hypothetical protein